MGDDVLADNTVYSQTPPCPPQGGTSAENDPQRGPKAGGCLGDEILADNTVYSQTPPCPPQGGPVMEIPQGGTSAENDPQRGTKAGGV